MKIAVVCAALVLAICAVSSQAIINLDVNRNIDLTSQVAKHNITIQFRNNGNSGVSVYTVAVPTQNDLWYIGANAVNTDGTDGAQLTVNKGDDAAGYVNYNVVLDKQVAAGADSTIRVVLAFVDAVKPYPTHIKQGEKQLVRYFDNHFFFSPYTSNTQTTTVTLSTATIESKSEEPPTSVNRETITYGPYNDVGALKTSALQVHFASDAPFLLVENLNRDFEISHWGNLAVEDEFSELRHVGAALDGSFSRFDYQRNPASLSSGVTQFSEVLPVGAHDVYYRDDIGNISTSSFKSSDKGLEMLITPRFPLFGGWKNSFYMGYNLPLSSYLFVTDDGRYQLNATIAVDVDNLVVRHLTVRVVLPEGAKNIEVSTPFPVDAKNFDTHFTYLDTAGRPVVVLEKKNIVAPFHNQYFQVTYSFSTTSLLQEPLLLVATFFFLFLLGMAYARFEFVIEKKEKVDDGSDARATGLAQRYRDLVYQRNDIHDSVETNLKSKLANKPARDVQDELVNYEAKIGGVNSKAQQLAGEIEKVNADLSDVVREIEHLEGKRHTTRRQIFNNEIALRNKNIDKEAYEQNKRVAEQSFNKLTRDVASLLHSLDH